MLRKNVLALLAVAVVGLAAPTMALAQGGSDRGGHGRFEGGPVFHHNFGGDPRFRIGWDYGTRPYDYPYTYEDYNYYDYAHAYRGVGHR